MKRASQKNDSPENFKVAIGKGDNQAGKGSVSRTIGPMNNAVKVSNGAVKRDNVGPKNAGYMVKGSY